MRYLIFSLFLILCLQSNASAEQMLSNTSPAPLELAQAEDGRKKSRRVRRKNKRRKKKCKQFGRRIYAG